MAGATVVVVTGGEATEGVEVVTGDMEVEEEGGIGVVVTAEEVSPADAKQFPLRQLKAPLLRVYEWFSCRSSSLWVL